MNRSALFSVCVSNLLLVACGGSRATAPSAPNVLDTTWRLVSLERAGQSALAVTAPDRYTLLMEASGRAGVRADCNSCGGRYSLAQDTLTLSPLACTLVGCPPDSLDQPYLGVLGAPGRLQSDGSTLTFNSSAGRLRFTK
jgi:heat shock protein HslJ